MSRKAWILIARTALFVALIIVTVLILRYFFILDDDDRPPIIVTNGSTTAMRGTRTNDAGRYTLSDVPAGTSCTVTETDNGGADGTSFTVNGGAPTSGDHVTVTPTDSSAVAVVASNRFDSKIVIDQPVVGFAEDPQLGPTIEFPVQQAVMGNIIRPGRAPMRLAAEVIGTAPIERVDVLHGTVVAQTFRPYRASDLGRRVRVLWQGAEYRGRGRETLWEGKLTVTGNRIARFAPVNFLNPERGVREMAAGTALAWSSVTTGNLAGIDLWLDDAHRGRLGIETNIVSGTVDLAALDELLEREVLRVFDHQHINHAVPDFAEGKLVPTTQNILAWLWTRRQPTD